MSISEVKAMRPERKIFSGNFIITSSQVAKSFTLMYVGERIEKCKKILARIKNEQTN